MRWIRCGGVVLFLRDRVIMNGHGSTCNGAQDTSRPDVLSSFYLHDGWISASL